MFTLGLLYVYLYIYIFLSLLLLTFSFIPLQLLTKWSLTFYLAFLQKYTNIKNLFFFLIFSLTGLPPVGLFFVKFNILSFVLYQTHFLLIIFLFLIFLLNMFYYIQIFNIKNFKVNIYSNLNSSIFQVWSTDSNINYGNYNSYHYTYFIVSVLGVIVCTIFFYTDLLLLLNL